MILIGQYDLPFVRRVGIAMTLYGLAFTQQPWSIFGDADKIRPYNPLTRVPTLVLDGGEVLIESHCMLDYLDSLVPPERRMFPAASRSGIRRSRSRPWRPGSPRRASACSTSSACIARYRTSGWTAAARRSRRARRARCRPRRADERLSGSASRSDMPTSPSRRHCASCGGAPGLVAMAAYPALQRPSARLEALPVFQTIASRSSRRPDRRAAAAAS